MKVTPQSLGTSLKAVIYPTPGHKGCSELFIRRARSPGCYGTYLLKYSPYEQAVCCSGIST